VLVDNIRILFTGQVIGGMATTLLYSVFEPWLLSELDHLCSSTATRDDIASYIFALISISNGFISIISGVFSEYLVRIIGSTKSLFIASIIVLISAA
jgi:MFS transporter, MFS domain-containing protein family, molybdate-anion transporter